MYSIPSQRRLRWLGHVRRMEDGRTPKDVLYGWLTSGSRRVGRPAALRSKDTCKRDMKTCKIDTDCWEDAAGDRARWRQKVKQGIEHADSERGSRRRTKAPSGNSTLLQQPMHSRGFICSACIRDFRSRIGLCSHTRRCSSTSTAV